MMGRSQRSKPPIEHLGTTAPCVASYPRLPGTKAPLAPVGGRPSVDMQTSLLNPITLVGEDIRAKAKLKSQIGIAGGNHGFQRIWPEALPETGCCIGRCRRRRGRRMGRERPVSQV